MTDIFMNLPLWGIPAVAILGTSFSVCMLLVVTQRWHGHFSHDHDLKGAQKIHESPVPRIGGLGLFGGVAIGCAVGFLMNGNTYAVALTVLVSALPVFAAGLAEDLTKRITIKIRLLASFASAALGVWLLDARLTDLDTPGLDFLIQYPLPSVLFTCFAVGGMTNSINIIDGLNGLAAGSVSLMLSGLACIAWMHGDPLIMKLCLWGIAAMLGFLILNFPFGRIFLGDGGAYLAGFWVAECGVLLLVRNPEVSTWAVLLACCYPVWETVYSMYRRRVVAHVGSGLADNAHLHQLLFRQSRLNIGRRNHPAWQSHGLATAAIWILVASCQVIAIVATEQTGLLIAGVIAFALIYICIYQTCQPRHIDEEPHPMRAG